MIVISQALGPLICSTLLFLWWLCISRARWFERLAGLIGIVVVMFLVNTMLHKSMVDSNRGQGWDRFWMCAGNRALLDRQQEHRLGHDPWSAQLVLRDLFPAHQQ